MSKISSLLVTLVAVLGIAVQALAADDVQALDGLTTDHTNTVTQMLTHRNGGNSLKTTTTRTDDDYDRPHQQPTSPAPSTENQSKSSTSGAYAPMKMTVEEKLKEVYRVLETLGRQIIDLQTFVEERIRSDGQTGVKTTRHVHGGTRPYYSDNHISASAISAHDHADYEYVLGLGEFVAVMNGVEFRTRHNDYMFIKPTDGKEFNAVERIPYPDMPPEVSSKPTIKEQVLELREWFRAFKNQDYSVRDYRKYFKPNLCYLEGGWTLTSRDELQEPFASDRHHLDASSWFDLSEKVRFSSYAGHMSAQENFAYLPTTLYNITENGDPQVAQWNYRILCHPLKQDLPTSYFRLQDDLAYRMAHKLPLEKIAEHISARFTLDEIGTDRETENTLLDKLMHEIPGKDNYGANLTDDAFGLMNLVIDSQWDKPINVGYYHRMYKVGFRGAMGTMNHYRGFNDPNLWVARTTQKKIMPLTIKYCDKLDKCVWQTRRVTYAMPLEVMYTTPLNKWNPYNFEHHSPYISEKKDRDGRISRTHAFNGTSYRHYYWTPIEFYHDDYNATGRPTCDAVGILDRQGQLRVTAKAGIYLVMPEIDGVGKVRTRYPIFPVHSQGGTVGEELEALKDMVMKMGRYSHLYEEPPMGANGGQANHDIRTVEFQMGKSTKNPPGFHAHDVSMTLEQYSALLSGKNVKVTSSIDLGHSHNLDLYYDATSQTVVIKSCDGAPTCRDGHPDTLTRS